MVARTGLNIYLTMQSSAFSTTWSLAAAAAAAAAAVPQRRETCAGCARSPSTFWRSAPSENAGTSCSSTKVVAAAAAAEGTRRIW